MADVPIPEIGDRTPLEYARTPNMDLIASQGLSGTVRTIPAGMPSGSDVAILSILGYDPKKYFTGRAPLEAARLGIHLSEGEIAFRCNLITVNDNTIVDYAAGHISTKDAQVLISFLNERLGTDSVRFHPGVSYRHICVIRGTSDRDFECTPPHDITGKTIDDHLPRGSKAGLIRELMLKSIPLLSQHEVNISRANRGLKPANMIWLWGQGVTPRMPAFKDRFGLDGGVISAVDLVLGIAKLIGLDCIEVPGATGYYDTNYRGKGEYASSFLTDHDLVLVHVEAADEASHNADLKQKIAAIENFDELVVGPIYRELSRLPRYRIMILPDHATPVCLRTHTSAPVPFACQGEGIPGGNVRRFSEREAEGSGLQITLGHKLMETFVGEQKW